MNFKPNTTTLLLLLLLTSCGGGGSQSGSTDPASGSISGSPAIPTNITAVGENSRILITWNAVNNADSYTVSWADIAGQSQNGTTIIVSSGTALTHEFLTDGKQRLTTGSTYYYRISAVNKNGASKLSNEIIGRLKNKPWLMPLLNSAIGN